MKRLTDQEILRLWERGRTLHPLDRALSMISESYPDSDYGGLAMLPIGERDDILLRVRESTFGGSLPVYCNCEECGESLEFNIRVQDIRGHEPKNETETLTRGDERHEIEFRLPNSLDLAALLDYRDKRRAYRELFRRCILRASANDEEVSPDELPEELLQAASQDMYEADTRAEILLKLECPNCEHKFQTIFDIVHFLWSEFSTHARRVLRDVHDMARYYGWTETDILRLNPERRKIYLEMIGT